MRDSRTILNNQLFKQEVSFDRVSPIFITDKILLKIGFKKIAFYENVYERGEVKMHTNKDDTTDAVLFVLYDGTEFVFQKEVSSLHQLQNLYFALTGEELDVKL